MEYPQHASTHNQSDQPSYTGGVLKHSSARIVLGAVFGVVILGAGIAYAYFETDVFGAKDPYTVVSDMFDALGSVESYEVEYRLDVAADIRPMLAAEAIEYEEDMIAYESRQMDLSLENNSLGSLSYLQPSKGLFTELQIEDTLRASIAFSLFSNNKLGQERQQEGALLVDSPFFSTKLNMKGVGATSYLQLENISAGVGSINNPFASMQLFMQPIMSTWVAFTLSDLGTVGGSTAAMIVDNVEDESEDYPEKLLRVKQTFANTKPLVFTDKGTIDGNYVYGVDVDVEAFRSFATEVAVILEQPEIRAGYQIEDMIRFLEMYQEKYADDISITLYIDKKSKLPQQLVVEGSTEYMPEYRPAMTEPVVIQLTSTVTFDRFNDTTDVVAPNNAISIEELMQQVMGGSMMLDSQARARDAKRLSDLKQLQTALELYYTDTLRYPLADEEIVLGEGTGACLSPEGFVSSPCTDAYMSMVPSDPEAQLSYRYSYDAETDTYEIKAMLETDSGGLSTGPIIATNTGITNEFSPTEMNVSIMDTDSDGLSDTTEAMIGTNPNNIDTDGDGYTDYEEYQNGYNPLGV